MKKALVAVALAAMLAAVAACGSSSSTGATGGGGPTSADRDKFVGTWTGNYGCSVGATVADKMVIQAGSGNLDLSVKIHVSSANPDTVTATLTSPTQADVPEQSMGGATGTAKLTLNGAKLEFRAGGMGMTCGGSDYTRMP